MAFSLDSSARLRRKVLDICQEHIRKVVDAVRELPVMLVSYSKKDVENVQKCYENIQKLESESASLKRILMRELAEAGALLLSREDFLRLTAVINEIADFATGIAYRIYEASVRNWNASSGIINDLIKLSEAVLDTVIKLRETIFSLNFGVQRASESAKNVESAEDTVDALYRQIGLKILESKLEVPTMILLREIATFLEEIADKAEDAADAARVLSLSAF